MRAEGRSVQASGCFGTSEGRWLEIDPGLKLFDQRLPPVVERPQSVPATSDLRRLPGCILRGRTPSVRYRPG